MKRMIISLVIEGTPEDLPEIKDNIIKSASDAIVSVTTNVITEPKKELNAPAFVLHR